MSGHWFAWLARFFGFFWLILLLWLLVCGLFIR